MKIVLERNEFEQVRGLAIFMADKIKEKGKEVEIEGNVKWLVDVVLELYILREERRNVSH